MSESSNTHFILFAICVGQDFRVPEPRSPGLRSPGLADTLAEMQYLGAWRLEAVLLRGLAPRRGTLALAVGRRPRFCPPGSFRGLLQHPAAGPPPEEGPQVAARENQSFMTSKSCPIIPVCPAAQPCQPGQCPGGPDAGVNTRGEVPGGCLEVGTTPCLLGSPIRNSPLFSLSYEPLSYKKSDGRFSEIMEISCLF